MSLLYLCHNYIGCCSILFTTLLFYYFTVFIIYGLAFAEGIFTKWETRHKEFILCKAPFSQKVKDSLFWTTLYFWYRRLRVFSSATGTMTSSAGNIEMAKVILISLWFLYCAHRNSYFTNGKLYMYTTRYTRRCLHQQEAVIFFHLIPGVEGKVLFLIERIIFGIIKFI